MSHVANSGVAQKGPLAIFSSVIARELDSSLAPNGRQYFYRTYSELGTFVQNAAFSSQYLGLIASGHYFDEAANSLSTGPVTLQGISDLEAESVMNVNLLTTLAYERIGSLVSNSHMPFSAARSQAEREVMASFNIHNASDYGSFSTFDLAKGRDGDNILAAISSVFVQGNTADNLGALIARFQGDIAANGRITSSATQATITASARVLDPTAVAANLSEKYAHLAVQFRSTDISDWIDQDGDGLVGRLEFRVADASELSVFRFPAFVTTPYAGTGISASAGRLAINDTLVTGAAQIGAADVVGVLPPAPVFADGALTIYLFSDRARIGRVTFVKGLASISVTPASINLPVGASQQFAARGTFTDASTADVTNSVTWSSSTPTIAAVNPATGLARAPVAGTAAIVASSGAVTGSSSLNVVPAALQSIAVAPNPLLTGPGIARQLRAVGTYSDGSTASLTTAATWDTSGPTIATVTGGLVTGVSVGSASVSARVGTVVGTTATGVTIDTWTSAASMVSGRPDQVTATLLPSGKVLVAGGHCCAVSTAEVYDPDLDKWATAANMLQRRGYHTATLLRDGKVLVAGGISGLGGTGLSDAEVYDPLADKWYSVATMANTRVRHTATLLQNGKVLVAGGDGGFESPPSRASAEVFDPASSTWSPVAPMATPRADHTATLLPDGRVLVAGGLRPGVPGSIAEVYDPVADTWSPVVDMTTDPRIQTATLLASGKVLLTTLGETANAGIFDPATNGLSLVAPMPTARAQHTATLLPTGKVLVAGGRNGSNVFGSAETYDPVTNSWSTASSMLAARSLHTATMLANGIVLVVGGEGSSVPNCELYW